MMPFDNSGVVGIAAASAFAGIAGVFRSGRFFGSAVEFACLMQRMIMRRRRLLFIIRQRILRLIVGSLRLVHACIAQLYHV